MKRGDIRQVAGLTAVFALVMALIGFMEGWNAW
jgi:hypothetical protein